MGFLFLLGLGPLPKVLLVTNGAKRAPFFPPRVLTSSFLSFLHIFPKHCPLWPVLPPLPPALIFVSTVKGRFSLPFLFLLFFPPHPLGARLYGLDGLFFLPFFFVFDVFWVASLPTPFRWSLLYPVNRYRLENP